MYFTVGHSQTLLEDFESNPATYSLVADEGLTSATVVSDPEANGTRGNVLKIITSTTGQPWQNAQATLTTAINLTTSEKRVSVDVYSTSAFVMLAKVDETGLTASASEKSHTGNGWETLTFVFTDGADNSSAASDAVYARLLFFPLKKLNDGYEAVAVTTTYVDNITELVVAPGPGSDATLSTITSGGAEISGFHPSTTSYTIELAAGSVVGDIPVLTAIPTQISSSENIVAATQFPGNAEITVTSRDFTTKVYTIYYIEQTKPSDAPNAPTSSAADVISLFSDAYTDIAMSTWRTGWSLMTGGTEETISNNAVKTYTSSGYAGISPSASIDVGTSGMQYISFDYWASDVTSFKLKLESPGVADQEEERSVTTGSWQTITIPLTDYSVDLTNINLLVFSAVGNTNSFYIDNVYFWKNPSDAASDATLSTITSGGVEITGFNPATTDYTIGLAAGSVVGDIPVLDATPTQGASTAVISPATTLPGSATITVTPSVGADKIYTIFYAEETPSTSAPTPTKAIADVISVYGNVYHSSNIFTDLNPQWGQGTQVSEYAVSLEDNILKYANLNYQGMLLATTDVSSMEYLHLDFYTIDATALDFYLIGGGTEILYNLVGSSEFELGKWVSVDIPLTHFAGVDLSALIQTKTVGNGTVYLDNIYFWKNPTWIGTDGVFASASNWSSGVIPGASSDITIPSDAELNITGDITVNSMSIAAGASIISDGSITGTVSYTRTIPTTNWHLISSPVVGQYKDTFLHTSGFATGSGSNVGFADYNNTTEAWSYYQSGTPVSGVLDQGEGHSVKLAIAGDVVFTGTFNDADVVNIPLTNNTNGYNLIGNPYLASVSVSELLSLTNNSDLLSESTVWLWDQSSYVQKNLGSDLEIAPGQAFFISANTSGSFVIRESRQSHSADTFQRTVAKPEVELSLSNGKASRTASIYYIDGTTTGFDNGYDSSIFGGFDNDFSLYTHAVANGTGRNLGIQSLPKGEYQNMIIPVGVIAESGSSLEFSASSENLPEGIKIFLEDREENTFIRLDALNASYKLTTESAINGVGRFYLHTNQSVLNINDASLDNVSVFKVNNSLRIVGLQQGRASVKLFNVLGRQVLNTVFESNGTRDISLPRLAKGVYIVHLETVEGALNKKIILE